MASDRSLCFDMDGVLLEGTGTPSWVYAAGADAAVEKLLPEDDPPD